MNHSLRKQFKVPQNKTTCISKKKKAKGTLLLKVLCLQQHDNVRNFELLQRSPLNVSPSHYFFFSPSFFFFFLVTTPIFLFHQEGKSDFIRCKKHKCYFCILLPKRLKRFAITKRLCTWYYQPRKTTTTSPRYSLICHILQTFEA